MNKPATQLTVRISWLGMLNYLGAILATGWMLYLIYGTSGVAYTLLALLLCGVILRFGASPLFVLAAGVLYFHFDAAGVWLPVVSALAGGAAFYHDLRVYRAQQAANH